MADNAITPPMSERAHTKGPWLIEIDNFGDYTIHREHETLAIAAVVNGEIRRMGGQSDQHEANASLIAAAPDMFEALKGILAHKPDNADTLWDAVEAALRLAKGPSHV